MDRRQRTAVMEPTGQFPWAGGGVAAVVRVSDGSMSYRGA